MRFKLFAVVAAMLSSAPVLAAPVYTIFDVPDAVSTFPAALNAKKAVTGAYSGTDGKLHGFVRDKDGSFTSFDPKGSQATHPTAIGDKGWIAGYYTRKGATHGFLRVGGSVLPLELAHAKAAMPAAINGSNDIAGSVTVGEHSRGFIRRHEGSAVMFDAPGAQDTFPAHMNVFGAVTGRYVDDQDPEADHGFIRAADGGFTTFDVAGAQSTDPAFIDDSGAAAGSYADSEGQVHAFLRAANGTITPFSVSGAASTTASGMDDRGWIYGSWMDGSGFSHGYVRHADGKIAKFNAPDATSTQVSAVNRHGATTGLAFQAGVTHGFLRTR